MKNLSVLQWGKSGRFLIVSGIYFGYRGVMHGVKVKLNSSRILNLIESLKSQEEIRIDFIPDLKIKPPRMKTLVILNFKGKKIRLSRSRHRIKNASCLFFRLENALEESSKDVPRQN